MIIIIIIIKNKQTTNILTNTKDSDNHCKNTKISHNSQQGSPQEMHCLRRLWDELSKKSAETVHPLPPPTPPLPPTLPKKKRISRKTTRNFPIEKSVYEKSQKIQNIYNLFFFRYIAER